MVDMSASSAIVPPGICETVDRSLTATSAQATTSPLDLTRRIPELDGLRGLAILMVVYMHYIWFAIGPHPTGFLDLVHKASRPLWSAVDLFFILSGFLIGGNLLDARDSPKYFSTFYIRRFSRVLPIYYVFVLFVGLAYQFVYRPINSASLAWLFDGRLPWYPYLLFTQNLWMTKWNTPGSAILSITWAFAVEVQFYLLVPALIRHVRTERLPYVFLSGIALAPVSRWILAHHFRANLWGTYLLLPSRMDSLFLGLLCAYVLRTSAGWDWVVGHRKHLWLIVVMLVAGIPALNSEGIPFTYLWIVAGYGWMSALYAAVLLLVVTEQKNLLSRALRWRWLTDIGTISYGIYLFHMAILGLCMYAMDGHGLTNWTEFAIVLISLLASMTLAKFSWIYFEKPIVRRSHAFRY